MMIMTGSTNDAPVDDPPADQQTPPLPVGPPPSPSTDDERWPQPGPSTDPQPGPSTDTQHGPSNAANATPIENHGNTNAPRIISRRRRTVAQFIVNEPILPTSTCYIITIDQPIPSDK